MIMPQAELPSSYIFLKFFVQMTKMYLEISFDIHAMGLDCFLYPGSKRKG